MLCNKPSNDFILSLDADEELSEKLIKSILEAKSDWKYDAYYFNRLILAIIVASSFPHWRVGYPDQESPTRIRLFDKRLPNLGKWYQILMRNKKLFFQLISKKFLKGDLLHYTYHTIEEHIKTD